MKKISINFKLKSKILLFVTLLLLVSVVLMGGSSYFISKNELDAQGQTILKNGVKMAIKLIDAKNEEVKKGSITLEEAQEQVKVYLLGKKNSDGTRTLDKDINLGSNGYFIVYDKEGLEVGLILHLKSKVWTTTDKSSKKFLLVQDQISKGINGGGFTNYLWTLPNSKTLDYKVTYSQLDSNWGWVVVAGSYMKDFNSGANKILGVLAIIFIIIIILGFVISLIFANSITTPIKKILNAMKSVENGDLNTKVSITSKNEIGDMANGFNSMVISKKNYRRSCCICKQYL